MITLDKNLKYDFDFSLFNNELEDLVYISLLTDRRVTREESPDNITSLRGWWGDTLQQDGVKIGSRIWIDLGHKLTPKVFPRLKNSIRDALQWMIDDGILTEVYSIRLDFVDVNRIDAEIVLTRNAEKIKLKFENLIG